MKKMKKLITLLISLTMIFALCACGQTAEPKTEEPAKTDAPAADVAAADEPVTLRLYTRYSDEDNIKRIDYAVEKLKEEYPNVTIEIEAMPAEFVGCSTAEEIDALDTVSGATVTSNALKEAVKAAMGL